MIKKYIAFVDFENRHGLPEQKLAVPFDSHEANMKAEELRNKRDVGKVEVIKMDVDSKEFPLYQKHEFNKVK